MRKTKGDDKKKEEYGRERRRKDNTNKWNKQEEREDSDNGWVKQSKRNEIN